MKIDRLVLNNFRNYKLQEISFGEGINILYGKNAQGKTNILEAVYLFSAVKSHRGAKDKELLNIGCDKGEIELYFHAQRRNQASRIVLFEKSSKKCFLNSIEKRTQKALFGVFGTVIFSPEDLTLIKEGPDNRRRFLNAGISQLRPRYDQILSEYKKLLDRKNILLKKESPDICLLDIYNRKLSNLAAKITVHRHQFVENLNTIAKKAHLHISGQKENIDILYKPNIGDDYELIVPNIAEKYENAFDKIKKDELIKRSSQIGPHRDDITFLINGLDAKVYASQGQQRSVILSLKLAEYEFMNEILSEPPILLLDDIFSELDLERQDRLLAFLNKGQTLITCTDRDLINKIKLPYRLFEIIDGNVFVRA